MQPGCHVRRRQVVPTVRDKSDGLPSSPVAGPEVRQIGATFRTNGGFVSRVASRHCDPNRVRHGDTDGTSDSSAAGMVADPAVTGGGGGPA